MRNLLCLLMIAMGAATAADESPWLTYNVYHGELAMRDARPSVSVFSDGRVEVYRRAWQPQSGLYEYYLNAEELTELVNSVTAPALMATDLATTEQDLAASAQRIKEEEQRVFAIADADTYHVEIDASMAPGSRSPKAATAAFVWEMPHPELVERASLPALDRLEALRHRLQDLATTSNADKIADAATLGATPR